MAWMMIVDWAKLVARKQRLVHMYFNFIYILSYNNSQQNILNVNGLNDGRGLSETSSP